MIMKMKIQSSSAREDCTALEVLQIELCDSQM